MAAPNPLVEEVVISALLVTGFSCLSLLQTSNVWIINGTILCLLQATGRLQALLGFNAHANPSITTSLAWSGKLSQAETVYRLIGQMIVAPMAVLAFLGRSWSVGFYAIPRYDDEGDCQCLSMTFLWEFVATFGLLSLIFDVSIPFASDIGALFIANMLPRPVGMSASLLSFAALCAGDVTYLSAIAGTLVAAVVHGLLTKARTAPKSKAE